MDNIGRVIEAIRQNQSRSIAEVCDGIVAPSTYSRFIRGKTLLSADSFLALISKLDISFGVFLQEYLVFFQLSYDYVVLHHAQETADFSILVSLIENYEQKKLGKYWYSSDQLFLTLLVTFEAIAHTISGVEPKFAEVLRQLRQIKYYSSNDLRALQLIFKYISLDDAESLFQTALALSDYKQDPVVSKQLLELCAQMIIERIRKGEFKHAQEYFTSYKELFALPTDLSGKLTVRQLDALRLFIKGEDEVAFQMIEDLLIFYEDLNLNQRSKKLKDLMENLGVSTMKGREKGAD